MDDNNRVVLRVVNKDCSEFSLICGNKAKAMEDAISSTSSVKLTAKEYNPTSLNPFHRLIIKISKRMTKNAKVQAAKVLNPILSIALNNIQSKIHIFF
jgi:hypothetical protein